jgi:predicted enzyme related to lactoylglutathione lyase
MTTGVQEVTTGIRKPGQFCWFNMLTSDTAKAREFFARVLGWTYNEIPNMGHMVLVGGNMVGGVWDIESPQTPPGTRPYIGVTIKVESADAAAEKVKSLGGDAKPAFDVMDQGRMAVCYDTSGVEFDVWQARNGPGMTGDARKHGMPSWIECATTNAENAKKFYDGLFGWTDETTAMPTGMNYTTFKLGEEYVAGMYQITPDMAGMKPSWAVYFSVDKVDEIVELAKSLGGENFMPAMDIPHVGRIAGLTSPQGVLFYAITNAPMPS